MPSISFRKIIFSGLVVALELLPLSVLVANTPQLDTVHERPHHQTTGGSGGGGGAWVLWFLDWINQLRGLWQGVSPVQAMARLMLIFP